MIADQANQLAMPLVPASRAARYWRVETPGPTFPHASETIHEEVVRDVGPALVGSGVVRPKTKRIF